MKRPRIILADDHAILSEGLRVILEPECDVVACVEDGRSLLAEAEKLQPDIVVLDISMPMLNGLDATRSLTIANPKIKVVILTMHSDMAHVREAFRAGARAYVLKRSVSRELLTAIREVLKDRYYLTPAVTKEVVEVFAANDSRTSQSFSILTPRQREVLQLLAEGHTIKDTAHILNISAKTVEFHKYRIMDEVGVQSIAELTQYAVKHGVITVDS